MRLKSSGLGIENDLFTSAAASQILSRVVVRTGALLASMLLDSGCVVSNKRLDIVCFFDHFFLAFSVPFLLDVGCLTFWTKLWFNLIW